MSLRVRCIGFAVAVALTSAAWAQNVPDNPPARANNAVRAPENRELPQSVIHRMPRPAAWSLGKLDKLPAFRDNQIGIHRLLTPATMDAGRWDTLPNGMRVWRLLVRSEGALSMRLHFRDFHAGDGKVMLFAAPDTTGAAMFRGDGPLGAGEFWSTTVFGDEAVIEYQPAPGGDVLGVPPFAVDTVSHAARPIRDEPRAAVIGPLQPEAAASCHLDVTCYATYAESARAVARIVFETNEGSFLCTGSLLNTRNSSLIPYFLTNNHCVNTQTVANTVETYWNYQTSFCNGPAPAEPPRSSIGSTLLSTQPSETLDYSFLRLPSAPSNAYYLGWSTTQPSLNSSLTSIGHPVGDYKRIVFGTLTGGIGGTKFTFRPNQGLTEGGSSGSPWLREPGVLIGLHARGNAGSFADPCRALSDGQLSGGGEWFSAIYNRISGWLEDAAGCTYSATAVLSSFSASGGSGSIAVGTGASCAWTAQSNAAWITLGATSGTGPGNISFTVAANAGAARSGTITVSGQTVTINQSAASVVSCTSSSITPGVTVNGTLSSACLSTQRLGAYAANYTFSGTAGQGVIIEMDSATIDPFVYLIGPGGTVVASDDDSGGALNARIPTTGGSFLLGQTGTYRIEATTYNAAISGAFTVTLTLASSSCTTSAISVGQTLNGTLSASDCLTVQNSGSYADVFQFLGTAGQAISILMTSPTMDTFLTLISPTGSILTTDDDSAGNLNSRIPPSGSYTLPVSGTYKIEASTYRQETGSYTLQLAGTCAAAGISIGASVNGSLASTDCDSTLRSAYADRYTFNGAAGQQIRVDLTSTAFDTYLYLLNPSGQLIGENNNAGAGTNSAIPANGYFTLPSTGTYVIEVSSSARSTGAYTLALTQPGATPASSMRMVAVTPCRVADTRTGSGKTGAFGAPALEGGATRTIPVPSGACGIPANAQAYVLNITVVPQGPLAYLTVWPAGQSQPLVSTLNSFEGRIVANMAIVPAGSNGAINIFVTNRTDVIVDINGYFAP